MFSFSCWQVAYWCLRTADQQKAKERFQKNLDTIRDFHARMWPGVRIPQHGSKRSKRGLPHQEDCDSWFPVAVLTTSMVMSAIAFCIAHPKRKLMERKYGVQILVELLAKFAHAGVALTLWFKRLRDDEWMTCVCWQEGTDICVAGSAAWTQQFYNEHVKSRWQADYRSPDKDWIAVSTGQFDVKLSSLLAFMLDASHCPELKDQLLPRAFSLLSQIAAALESNILSILTPGALLHQNLGALSRTKRLSDSVGWHLRQLMAQRLWSGQDPYTGCSCE